MLTRVGALSSAARRAPSASHVLRRSMASSRVAVCGNEDTLTAATKSEAGSIVYFTASWCGPCRMISPIFDELATANATGATFLKVDVDDMPEVAAAAQVSAMPTFQFFKAGQLLDKIVGADAAKLTELAGKHLS